MAFFVALMRVCCPLQKWNAEKAGSGIYVLFLGWFKAQQQDEHRWALISIYSH